MHSLTRDESATLDLQPRDRAVLDREFERAGWVTVLGIQDRRLRSIRRYKPSYFRHLCVKGQLPMKEEEQLVIGLD